MWVKGSELYKPPYLSQRVELRILCSAEAYHPLTPTDRSLVLQSRATPNVSSMMVPQ
jgi:hypothetical protein